MKRIDQITQKLAGAGLRVASLAFVVGFLANPASLHADSFCPGGTVIYNSSHMAVGCSYSSSGPTPTPLPSCNVPEGFSPANPGPGTCNVCIETANASIVRTIPCLNCVQPPPNLLEWWTFDDVLDISSGYTVDIGPNHDTGQLYGNPLPTSVAGEVGSALHFNGTNYVQVLASDNDIPANGDFSFDAWVKLDSPTTPGVRVIVEKRTFTSPNHFKGYSFYLYNYTGSGPYLGLQLADDGAAPGYTNYGAGGLTITDTNWHFVAVSVHRSGTGSNPFQVLFTLDNYPPAMPLSTSPARYGSLVNPAQMNIGMDTIGQGSGFIGTIDEVEFFNRAVTPAEWQSIFSANSNGQCRPANLPYVSSPQ